MPGPQSTLVVCRGCDAGVRSLPALARSYPIPYRRLGLHGRGGPQRWPLAPDNYGSREVLSKPASGSRPCPCCASGFFLCLPPFGNFICPVDLVQDINVNNALIVSFT